MREKLKRIADHNGLKITDKLNAIVGAKRLLLGDKWIYCPCEANDVARYCGSEKCLAEINEKGVCHCGLFAKK